MLCNPVVLHPLFDPFVWILITISFLAEYLTVATLLKPIPRAHLPDLFLATNLFTWISLVVMTTCLVEDFGWNLWAAIAVLEVAVTLLEALLYGAASRGRFVLREPTAAPLRWVVALRVSTIGNTVSIAVSLTAGAALLLA